jgi:hypothetical protein
MEPDRAAGNRRRRRKLVDNPFMEGRLRAICLLMGCCVTAASVVYADLKKGYYAPAELGSMRQTAPLELMPDSNYRASPYPVPAVDLAHGEGLQEVQIYCNTCHSPSYVMMQPPLPAATWEAEVNKMNKTFGAEIPPDSTQKIVQYLETYYTPENRRP